MQPIVLQISQLTRKRLTLKLRAAKLATEIAAVEADLKRVAAVLTGESTEANTTSQP